MKNAPERRNGEGKGRRMAGKNWAIQESNTPVNSPGNPKVSQPPAANSAVNPPDLAEMSALWGRLPVEVRAGLLAWLLEG